MLRFWSMCCCCSCTRHETGMRVGLQLICKGSKHILWSAAAPASGKRRSISAHVCSAKSCLSFDQCSLHDPEGSDTAS